MTPVIHCSIGSAILLPRTTFIPRKGNHPARWNISQKYPRPKSSRLLLSPSSLRLFRLYGNHYSSRKQARAAVDTDVTVEEPNSVVSEEAADENPEVPSAHVESTTTLAPEKTASQVPPRSKRPRPARKSEMPPVKDEELVPGAWFTGEVRSVQPFGCFVDFGAFTDGLVHVSRLSDAFVKDVASFVSIGQEVRVRIVEANKDTGRISLSMRENDLNTKMPPKTESPKGETSEKPRSGRKNAPGSGQKREDVQKSSKFEKGQILNGTVKNVTRSGAFVSLPDGEEGFLPVAEESEGFGGVIGNSSLQVGQEVNVRVLRIARGKITLTMKKKEDVEGLNRQLNKGVIHVATNPFELAFRQNKEIAAFLDERDRTGKSSDKLQEASGQVGETSADSDVLEVSTKTTNVEGQLDSFSDPSTELRDEKSTDEKLQEEALTEGSASQNEVKIDKTRSDLSESATFLVPDNEEISKTIDGISSDSVSDEDSVIEQTKDSIVAHDSADDGPAPKEEDISISSNDSSDLIFVPANDTLGDVSALEDGDVSTTLDTLPQDVAVENDGSKTIDVVSSDSVVAEASLIDETEDSAAADGTTDDVLASKQEIANDSSSESIIDDVPATDDTGNVDAPQDTVQDVLVPIENDTAEDVSDLKNLHAPEDEKISATPRDSSSDLITNDLIQVAISQSENVTANLGNGKESPSAGNGTSNPEKAKVEASGSSNIQDGQGNKNQSTVSPALVKQLRDETGAGMMDSKKALMETGGDIVKAQEYLRKKGLASADKKAGRATAEGRIGSYIHDNRIGVLIEVNCETDFVSRGEIFKELVDDLAMQVAACPQVSYLEPEDVPLDIVNKEREIEMQKEDLLTKPQNIRSKIVDGRIKKRLEELALLEQPYIKNDKIVVRDWIKQTIAIIGENIKVRRFVRYNLGEGLEKKSQDFAAEVAAQTSAKPSNPTSQQQTAEPEEVKEKPSTVTVPAALVKQLREETGAGMMDCKRALAETCGDIEKAQEYLRKKGLSSAEKKSSRLAAEGRIASYIHDSRIGALIEVNCETDFVGRNENFKELVEDLAMQVVACPQVEFVSIEEIPESIVEKEKEIEMGREDLQSKPEQIKEKIVEGRITKRLGELALLEQPFIKDDSIKVKDLVKQTVASLGENMKVRRFVRFTLGENKD